MALTGRIMQPIFSRLVFHNNTNRLIYTYMRIRVQQILTLEIKSFMDCIFEVTTKIKGLPKSPVTH